MANKKLTRVLSIDGGGIRGVLPGQIMVAIEQQLQKKTNNPEARLADYFDLMAGTSTGGILCAIYLTPDESGRPKYTAEQAVNLYLENGGDIFKKKMFSFGGITNEKYPSAPMEEALEKYLGNAKLSEMIKECLITSYDIERSNPHFFKRHKAIDNKGYDFYMRDVARSTSAAPTYFEPNHATSFAEVKYALIDGGVYVNNPTLCAYAATRKLDFGEDKIKPTASEMMMVSIGTGSTKYSYEYEKAKDWGAIGWIKPLIDIMMKGVSQTVDYQLKQIFDAVGKPDQYYRIEPKLVHAVSGMDNAGKENLINLRADGSESALDNEDKINKIVDMLIANA
ncbi:patatin-like phospholipase family protein [Microscilla marina]|uniref:Patatin family protein n=1 Tax=Microscilla marina ATCC 23134 TaxID=313606 RepID=A1ZMA4_MICM2|nr:patatin-like phospholipase family protein [Microscilla marina]EAY28636.1 patatin family protein [Microscilla marina ATCC 23134]